MMPNKESLHEENPVESLISLKNAFSNALVRVVLPQLKEIYPEEMKKTLRKRWSGGQSNVEDAFWAGYYAGGEDKILSAKQILGLFGFGLDLVMDNKGINLEKRREIVGKFWKLCEKDFGITRGKNEKVEL